MDNKDSAVIQDKNLYGKKIKSVPKPEPDIGLETNHSLVNDILETSDSSLIDTSVLNTFLDVSRSRDQEYAIIDQMCQDSIPSAILELYCEDSTATNDKKEVIWVTSDDSKIAKTVDYILKSFQINKNIYRWVSSLVKYGDLYVRLYKLSEYNKQDALFDIEKDNNKKQLNESDNSFDSIGPLKEDINIHVTKNDDHFVPYVEMISNPASMYELTRFGKTAGFIQTHIPNQNQASTKSTYFGIPHYSYQFNQSDIDVYQSNQFVHASLDDNVDRVTEEVNILLNKNDDKELDTSIKYQVRSGQSIFYNTFKIWRELSLLETSLILSRITKSSITRVIQVETGNTAKEETSQILQSVKQLIEQKAALNPGSSMAEYNNPGPMENNIYMATHDGKGAITTSQIGGEYDPKQLTDLDYFKNKFYGSLGIPKQYFGDTDDGAGFNGGQSLTIISAKYAKKIVKIQTAIINMLRSLVNIILLDRGLDSYIDKFTINMLEPTTQEDIDRREASSNKVGLVRDIMDLLNDVEDKTTKLKILKSLLSDVINDAEVIELLEGEIDKLEDSDDTEDGKEENKESYEDDFTQSSSYSEPLNLDSTLDLDSEESEQESGEEIASEETVETPEETILPTPGETGVDLLNSEE